ncbi:isochorismate synthase [Pseudomonas gingeri]|uniref:isochorismate synthase n=1 Tax=Pseudomonas gingeri TaxID=117681 RepID=UPI00159F8B66|nr:isochorismate synthase [Pseudomonas gingeri]NWA11305.1 isochorismate synthase [Pseudomonas gingeri]
MNPLVDRGALLDCLELARQRAIHGEPAVLACFSCAWLPCDGLRAFAAAQGFDQAVLWQFAESGPATVGVGSALELELHSGQSLVELQETWQHWIAGAVMVGTQRPRLFGGRTFDRENPCSRQWQAFAEGAFVLPRLSRQGEHLTLCTLVTAQTDCPALCQQLLDDVSHWRESEEGGTVTPLQPGRRPRVEESLPAEHWKARVADAVAAIEAGELRKVVLAREVKVEADTPFSLPAVLQALAQGNPTAYLFALRRGDSCFLGATPERLVLQQAGQLRTTALAGSIPRGTCAQSDRANHDRLLASAKDRHEHALVVETLRSDLGRFTASLDVPAVPAVHRLAHIQHLMTPIRGRLLPGVPLLALVEALHPTPAVGGLDRQAAIRWIRRHESLHRGWYAAPVGWLDSEGDGEFAVALRSALVCGEQAWAFAGCGLVAGSEPELEYRETCVKLKTMLDALAPGLSENLVEASLLQA